MKPDEWFPLYIGDYLRKTMRLTRDQHGAYLLLIMACWMEGGRIPSDAECLASTVKATAAEWRKLSPIILPYFTVSEGFVSHGRVTEELDRARAIMERNQENGRGGGRPRKNPNETQTKPKDNPNHNPNETHAQVARPLPSTLTEESLSSGARESSIDIARVREAAGDALASMATHPGVASLHTLNVLLAGVSPCDIEADILPAITSAAAWHRARAGRGSMTNWTLAVKMAIENRDRRLAGLPPPKEVSPDDRIASFDAPSAKRAAREANLARAWAGSEIAIANGTK